MTRHAGQDTADRVATIRSEALDAHAGGRWGDVVDHASRLLAVEPGDIAAALLVAEGSREVGDLKRAEAALAPFRDRLSESVELSVSHALNAERQEQFGEAARRWRIARGYFPGFAYAWAAEATCLSILGRLEDAEALLDDAVGRGLTTIEIMAARVHLGLAGGDWMTTWRRWRSLSNEFPDAPYPRSVADQVREATERGLAGLGGDELRRLALVAEAELDWDTSLLYWTAARDGQPGRADFITGIGRVFRRAGRFDEADRIFCDAFDRHSDDVEFRANFAEVAASRKDWSEALKRWEATLRDFPDVAALWSMAATAYREVGHLEQARRLLTRAADRDPDNVELVVQLALTAEKCADWKEAIARWDQASALLPDDLVIRDARGNAIWEQQIARLEAGENAPREASDSDGSETADQGEGAASLRSLALSFEGLGDQCEFGIVQRRLGADPIGLFRFAAISAENLVALLDDGFDKLGDPDHTELGMTDGGEYLVRDRRNLYHMHSFVQKDTVDPAVFLSQQVRRLGYLKRKLIDDLTAAEKIFVFKSSLSRISDQTLLALRAAIARYGDGILIGLRRAEEDHPPGSVSVIAPRTLVGYLNTEYRGEQMPIDFASWRRVLVGATRHRTTLIERVAGELASG